LVAKNGAPGAACSTVIQRGRIAGNWASAQPRPRVLFGRSDARFHQRPSHTTGTKRFALGDGMLFRRVRFVRQKRRARAGLKQCYSGRADCRKLGFRPARPGALFGRAEARFHQRPFNTTGTKRFALGGRDAPPAGAACSPKTAHPGRPAAVLFREAALLETGLRPAAPASAFREVGARYHQRDWHETVRPAGTVCSSGGCVLFAKNGAPGAA
jgi:hypothetical protein